MSSCKHVVYGTKLRLEMEYKQKKHENEKGFVKIVIIIIT